jgi:hypothetical protein
VFQIRFLSVVPKLAAAGSAGLMLAGGLASSAPSASLVPVAAAKPAAAQAAKPARPTREARVAVRVAVLEAEADVLGMKPEELREALRGGKTVEQLADARHITKDQFSDRLGKNLKPRLDALVKSGKITAAQEDRVLKAIAKGDIPWWHGLRHHTKRAA